MTTQKTLSALYLDYVNNFITTERFASFHGIPQRAVKPLIKAGKICHETSLPESERPRRNLTAEQREEIRQNADGLSVGKLADRYGVTRRAIQFILNPDRRTKGRVA